MTENSTTSTLRIVFSFFSLAHTQEGQEAVEKRVFISEMMFKELGAPNIYPAAAVKCFGEQKVLVYVRNTKVVTFVFITEEHDWGD